MLTRFAPAILAASLILGLPGAAEAQLTEEVVRAYLWPSSPSEFDAAEARIEAEPGFVFSDNATGPTLRAAATRAGGGYLPGHSEMDAGFVAWGPGIARGVRIPVMHQTDVAPTLAPLMGVALEGAEGRVLVGVLRLPRVSAPLEP